MRTYISSGAVRAVNARRDSVRFAEANPSEVRRHSYERSVWACSSGLLLNFLLAFAGIDTAAGQIPNSFDPPVAQIAAGENSTCAITVAGTVECWGTITKPLGITVDNSAVPVTVTGLSGIVAVSTGSDHICALSKAGAVQCLGANSSGQLGNGLTADSTSPVAVKGLDKGVAAIAAGRDFSCALTTAGAVQCWGNNEGGQLGNNSLASSPTPVPVSGLDSGIVAITMGPAGDHVCVLTAAGAVECWGANDQGQLGNGTTASSSVPIAVSGLSSGVVAISAGEEQTCAATRTGAVLCWGSNYRGQLGTGSTTNSYVPAAVKGLNSGVTAIASGNYHTCALTAAGAVLCWGEDSFGQLGDGQNGYSYIPVLVAGLNTPLTSITAGRFHTCGLTSTGAVLCWGDGGEGELGSGVPNVSSTPILAFGLSGMPKAVSISETNTCILTTQGGVMCRGRNGSGQLGNGTDGSTFVAIDGLSRGVTAITTGSNFACALIQGTVKCWGDNVNGKLGNGSTQNSSTPVTVSGLGGIKAITTSAQHTCALDSIGGVNCWGNNAFGYLGSNTFLDYSAVPLSVIGLSSGATAVAAGPDNTCAIVGGQVLCWGNNHADQLGNDSGQDSATPTAIKGLSNIQQIAVGDFFACALDQDNLVWCWGADSSGELGNNSKQTSSVPVQVVGFSGKVNALTAGNSHICALIVGGSVQCWGSNDDFQLGAGPGIAGGTGALFSPTNGSSAITAVVAGGNSTCELTSGGELACWGANDGHVYSVQNSDSSTPSIATFNQWLSFAPPTSLAAGATLTLSATAYAGRAGSNVQSAGGDFADQQQVMFDTWTPDTCTVDGTKLTVVAKKAGLCGVRASQPGSANGSGSYADSTLAPAPQQLRLIQIQAGAPPSTTTLAASAASTVFGQPVTLTATVAGKAPGGNVVFSDGSTPLCTVALSGGGDSPTATCSGAALAAGTHTITAAYAGDANNAASTSSLSYVVAKAATTLMAVPAASSILAGTSVNVVGNVSVVSPGAGMPTGTISVQTPGGASCSYSLAAKQPGCSITPKGGASATTITVSYSGDDNFSASTATAPLTLTFTVATVSLTSSPNPSAFGHAVNFTVQVSQIKITAVPGQPGEPAAQATEPLPGRITISDGATLLASLTADVNGQATYSTSALGAGSHTITAAYSGDETQGPGYATLVQQVNAALASATVVLTSSPNPSAPGQAVTFTATVTALAPASASRDTVSGSFVAAAAPGGTITLHDNGALLASVPLNASGQAAYSTSALAAGSHTITVDYSGDANTAPASSVLIQQVAAAIPAVPAPALGSLATLLLVLGVLGMAAYGFAQADQLVRRG